MGFVEKISRRLNHKKKLSRYGNAYLRNKGWHQSFDTGASVTRDNKPIPWITYPAIMMLKRVVAPHHNVFEFGCGNSSLWWASRVASIISVEHDEVWARKVSEAAPENLKVIVRNKNAPAQLSPLVTEFFSNNPDLPTSGEVDDLEHGFACKEFISYATVIEQYDRHFFDIIVVDGMARSLTAWMAIHFIKPNGLIVFDNSERWQYNPAFKMFSDNNFARIDFYGPGPLSTHETCTSIFCKSLDWAARNPLIDGVFKTVI